MCLRQAPCIRLAVASLLILCFSAIAAWAQGSATIVGTITDPSGAALPGVTVRVVEESTGLSREVIANDQGYFVAPSLRPSTYSVSVQASGFSPYTRKGILLQADESATVNVPLSLSQSAESIVVEASASQVNTTTAVLSEVVDTKRIVELPLNGRNAASLALVVAGATLAPGSDADQGNSKTFPAAVTVSLNGSRQNQTNFRLDGSNNNDIYTNVNQPFPFPDALQEFSVQTSNYPARYGGNAGGVLNVVTRSGTNEFHGDAFEFVRNAEFNARNFFATRRDQLKRNQFGGTLGGPLSLPRLYNGKNRTFFFAGYQGTRIRNVSNSSNAFVPTAANLNGDFSALLDARNPANPLGKAVQIIDPLTNQPFLNNQIPVSRFDPAAVRFTKYLPQAGGNGQVFYGQPIAQNFNEVLSRGDHSISEKDRIQTRYFFDRFVNAPFLDLSNYLNNSSFSRINSHNAMLGETHIFSPTMLNDLRLNFNREISVRGPAQGSINVNDLGLNIFQPPGERIIESLSVAGYFSIGQSDPASFNRNQYSITDDFSWIKGKHNLSIGGSAIRGQVLLRNQFLQPGQFGFTADYTGNALASFLLGKLRTFRQGFGEFKDNNLNTFNLYIQDDYHVTRKLTLNLGLRYDPFFPWKEKFGRIEQFRVDAYLAGQKSQMFTNAPPGIFFPGDPGVPEAGIRGAHKNFAPRIGFAYDLTGDGKTSLRGGGGIFYDALQPGIYNNRFVDVTPFSTQITLTDPQGPFSNPYSGITNPYPAPFPPPSNIAFPLPLLAVTYDAANGARFQTPVTYNWNLMVERQLGASILTRIAYVGSRANHLLESVELSPAVYTPGSTLSTDARRLFPQYNSIALASQDINSSYHSMQLTFEKRFSRGFTILSNYTWSKSLDDLPYGQGIVGPSSSNLSPIPWYMPGRHQFDYGPSEFDHKHRFVTSYVWDLPKLSNNNMLVRNVVGGWQLTGIFTYQSGGPLTILAGTDRSQTGLGQDRAVYLGGDVYGGNGCGSSAPCVNWVNPAAFGLPATGTFGNVGKGALRGPNLVNYDGGLFKEFHPGTERLRFQFRAEFFNLFNRVNLNNPGVSYSAAGFGSIKGAGDPRIGQLALKLLF